nr:cbb3-type cytochrome c oxidase subunit I [Acidimicrobiia bacterium]
MSVTVAPPDLDAGADPDPPEPEPAATGLLAFFTTTDHKRIGIAYMVTAFAFFLFAGALAMLIRAELAEPGLDVVEAGTYNQLFTMHGSIMMFLFIGPFAFGLANYLVPLHVGAPDMSFPRLNALSYWLYLGGGLTMVSGFLTSSGAADFGWFGYAPLSLDTYSPGVGADLWLIGLLLTGFSAIFTAVNIITTVFTLRAPGM